MLTGSGCNTLWVREMRSLLTTFVPFSNCSGRISLSNNVTNHRIGRENRPSPCPQRINRLPSKFQTHWGTSSVKISAMGRPGICLLTKTKSPLSVGRISKAEISTPCLVAKPMAALVGCPSLKAACAGGPLISSSLSACWEGKPVIRTANRRGVP